MNYKILSNNTKMIITLTCFLWIAFLLLWILSIVGVMIVSVPVTTAFLALWIIFLIASIFGYWSPTTFNYGLYNTWNITFILWVIFFILWVLASCSILILQQSITTVFLILWILFLIIWFLGSSFNNHRHIITQYQV
jgi:hypothetical protein